MDQGKIREDLNRLRSGWLEKRWPNFFEVYLNLYESVIYNAGKILFVCYVAVIFPTNDICSPNLKL